MTQSSRNPQSPATPKDARAPESPATKELHETADRAHEELTSDQTMDDVAHHVNEMNRRGARQRGEGRIR